MTQEQIKLQHAALGVHPNTIKKYLTRKDGSLREVQRGEWMEDYGLGYIDRIEHGRKV